MAVGPAEDSIETFQAFTSLPRENAIAWLQANNNEVEKAADAYFSGGGAPLPAKVPTVQWTENDFHADKSGDSQQNGGQNSFTVNHQDTLNPNVFGAPSRPPSRVSTHGGRAQGAQEYVETEEEQMNRALQISLSDSQTLPGQETGVTDWDKPAFGPAQREYYDTKQWSMTVPGPHAQEILLSPEPFNRKRQPGTPAFLKPVPDAPRLSTLIKILHEIPVAREALLNAEILAPDYGRDSQWWEGDSIKQLRVVNVDQGYQGIHSQDLVHETQRLMAFLDGTERAYGSVDNLIRYMDRVPRNADKEIASFLEDWQSSTGQLAPQEHLRTIFRSRGVRRGPEEGDDKHSDFDSLNVSVSASNIDIGYTLYDALDDVIWEGNDNNVEVFLEDIGNIVIFNVTCWSTSATRIGIDIPATWYPDRYLESSIPQAKKYRERLEEFVRQRDELDWKREKLLSFKTADALSLLARTTAHLEQTLAYQQSAGKPQESSEQMDTADSSGPNDLLEQLKVIDERIARKLKALEQATDGLNEMAKENALLYTRPTDDPETCPSHDYTLRGVTTTPSTCYVLEKSKFEADGDLIDLGEAEWQWWKLEYVNTDAKPVVATKVSEAHVLEAAKTETRSVMLVYADEYAVNYEPTPLSSQLANFVRTDNLSFQAELDESTQTVRESPGKRKALSDDSDDLITEHGRTPPFERDCNSSDPFESSQPFEASQPTSHSREAREEIIPHYLESSCLDPPNSNENEDLAPPPAPVPSFRTLKPKSGAQGSSDDNIPISFRRPMDPKPTALDQFKATQQNQEMQERSAGTSFLQTKGKYKLGSYVPEIDMEDERDGPPPNDHDPSSGRGPQGEMW